MNKFLKAAIMLPVATLSIPVLATAAETKNIEWNQTEDTIHLHNDVRTITFSKPVDPNSLKDISLWNKTTEKAVGVVATIGEKNNQVKVSLATHESYTNYHSYTLTIKGVKEDKVGTEIKATNYHYKMVASSPNELPFASSYVVTNTSGSSKTFKLPAGASYVIYNEYGTHAATARDGVELAQETNVSLRANDRMTVSFLETTQLSAQDGFKIEPTKDAAYTLYKVYKNTSIKIKGQDNQSQPDIYFGNKSEQISASYAEYTEKNTASDFEYNIKVDKTFKSNNLLHNNEMILTNENDGIVYVYAPKTIYQLTTVEAIDEKAVVALTLARNEKVQANSTEPDFNTSLQYTVPEGQWKISSVTYDGDEVANTIYSEQKAAVVMPTGDTIIKNEIGLPITVSGPGRFVTLKPTTEEPLTFYSLNKDDKVKATASTEKNFNIFLADSTDSGIYSSMNFYKDTLNAASLNDAVSKFGDDSFVISKDFTTIIENTSTQPLQVYGAARKANFQAYNTPLFTELTLAPGEKVQIESTRETKLYIQDVTSEGSFSYKQGTNIRNVKFGGLTKKSWINFTPNETVTVENTGNTDITLFTNTGDAAYIK